MNTILIGLVLVIGFAIWKFIIQPMENEGKPIEPPTNYKSFPEQMEEAMNPETDI